MDSQLIDILQGRCDAIADAWYRVVAPTGYVPLSAEQVRQHLVEWTAQLVSFLCADPVEPARVEEVGASLARLHYLQPEALGRTLGVLGQQLVRDLPARQAAALQPRLAVLLEGLATGFMRQASATILVHQEETRSALVHDLRAAEREVRQAHDELEARVERRTKALARANEELRAEIAERRRVASALRESQQQFMSLAEQSPHMIFINKMGPVVYVNRQAEVLLGYQKEEYYAEDFDLQIIIAPEYRELTQSSFARHSRGEEVEPLEYALLTNDGRRLEILLATKLVHFDGERAILGIVTDISDLKDAQEAVRRSEAQYRAVIDSMGDAIHVVDADLRILVANHALTRWLADLGLDTGVVGKNVFEAFPFLPPHLRGEYDYVFETGRLLITEERSLVGEGDLITETRKIPVLEDGRAVQVITVVRDVTERKRAEAERDATLQALRKSEGQYRMLHDSIQDGVYTSDSQGRFTFVNDVIVQRSGRPAEWFLGRSCFDVMRPEDREHAREKFEAVLRGEQVPVFEVAYPTATGDLMWLEMNTAPIFDNGKIVGVHGVSRDITWRKQAAEALRQSESKYRLLLESFRDGVYTLDAVGRFTFVNDAIVKRSGRPPEWFLGKSYFDVIRPEDREHTQRNFEAVMCGEQVPPYELAHPTASGALLWVEINTTALRDDGTIVGVHGVSRDITWRKQAEAALQESEQRWRSLVENAPDTVLTVDREGRVLFINRPLTSPTAQEALGKDVTASVRSDNREEVQATIQRVFETGEPGYVEAAAAGPGGVTAWYAARMGPVWREGEVAAALVVVRNITEQKRLEEMKDNLIRDVSHELRTPLSKMQMGMELLMELIAREAIDRGRVARIGEVTTSNVQRLLHTVETILDLSALEAGHTAYRMEPLGLAGLIDDVVYDMQPLAEAKGLELRAEVPERLPPIRADWQHLFRVLTNLIDNAIKFTDEGAVVVSAQQKDTELEIAVSDSGRGISKQSLPRLFERFFQETPGTTPGLGAGLAICRTITEAHGGRIWVESAGHGLGSTFRVRLPLESSPDAGA